MLPPNREGATINGERYPHMEVPPNKDGAPSLEEAHAFKGGRPNVEGATTYSGALAFLEEGAIFGGRLTIFRGAPSLGPRFNPKSNLRKEHWSKP